MRSGTVFVAVLWALGLAAGVVAARAPGLLPIPFPQLAIPLLVGFVAELALRSAVESGRVAPITGGERGLGVIGGAAIGIAAEALLTRGGP